MKILNITVKCTHMHKLLNNIILESLILVLRTNLIFFLKSTVRFDLDKNFPAVVN